MKIFVILKNSDQNAGCGHMVLTSIAFRDYEKAREFVASDYYGKKFGVQGMPGGDYFIEAVDVYDSVSDFQMKTDVVRKNLREIAIGKLTKEELSALLEK
jgi:hypothetical protein